MKIDQYPTYIEGHHFEEIMGNIIPKVSPKICLSHGLNDLPIPTVLKETMRRDVELEGLRNYGDLDYDRLLCGLIINYQNLRNITQLPWGHCNVIESATYAVSCVANYARFKTSSSRPTVLLAGLNYYLIYEILHQAGFAIDNLFGQTNVSPQPSAQEITQSLKNGNHDILVLSQPSNPTGEIYSPADLEIIYQACVENSIFLVIDCICADLESKASARFGHNFIAEGILNDQLAIIDGITKRRSCAGIRTAYVLGSTELMEYIDYRNETMIFYPPFLGIKTTIAEYLFQSISWYIATGELNFNNALEKTLDVVISLAEKPAQKGKFKELIGEILPADYESQFKTYSTEVDSVKKTIQHNYAYFMTNMADYLESLTSTDSGFSCAVMFKNPLKLLQGHLCPDIYQQIAIYLYPDVYFGNLRHKIDSDFWIRIGCALPQKNFKEGTDRLLHYLKEKMK